MLPTRPRHALLVLWLGLAALALHAFAGIAHTRAAAESDVIEVCTAQGKLRLDARTMQPLPPADAESQQNLPCCDLCGASCAPAVTAVPAVPVTAFSPARAEAVADRHRSHSEEALTPVVPRGPPARS